MPRGSTGRWHVWRSSWAGEVRWRGQRSGSQLSQEEKPVDRHRRVEIGIKVNLQYGDRATFEERFSQNLSRSGIFIRAKDPPPIGSRVRFEYRLADDSRVMRGVGIVRWRRAGVEA